MTNGRTSKNSTASHYLLLPLTLASTSMSCRDQRKHRPLLSLQCSPPLTLTAAVAEVRYSLWWCCDKGYSGQEFSYPCCPPHCDEYHRQTDSHGQHWEEQLSFCLLCHAHRAQQGQELEHRDHLANGIQALMWGKEAGIAVCKAAIDWWPQCRINAMFLFFCCTICL